MTATAATIEREDVRRILHSLDGAVQPIVVLAAVMLDEALKVAAFDHCDQRLGGYPSEARAWLIESPDPIGWLSILLDAAGWDVDPAAALAYMLRGESWLTPEDRHRLDARRTHPSR